MFSATATTVNDLEMIAGELLKRFSARRVFAFYANMGAGKTTLIQALCRNLGSTDNITSPTFALINEYDSAAHGPLYHFDFYRINSMEEAFDMGYEDYFYSGNYCFIEWPEKVEPLLPPVMVRVSIETTDREERIITAHES